MRAMRSVLGASVLAASLALGGCATIRGSQDSIPGLSVTPPMSQDQALQAYWSGDTTARHAMTRRDYRDYVIALYLAAIDDRYRKFTAQLQGGNRGSGLGLDLLVLGLNGAAALSGASSAGDISTLAAVSAGARSTIDKRLYFDQTLPSVIAAMDAERAAIKADIAVKRKLPIERYGLEEAFGDISRLVDAGSISAAVRRMGAVTQADNAKQQERLEKIVAACQNISTNAAELNRQFRVLVKTGDAAESANLAAAAAKLGMDVAPGQTPGWIEVASAFDQQLCDDQAKARFIEDLKEQLAPQEDANG